MTPHQKPDRQSKSETMNRRLNVETGSKNMRHKNCHQDFSSAKSIGRFGLKFRSPTLWPFAPLRSAGLAFTLRFFEAEEVEVPAGVTGDDQVEGIGKCAV